MKKGRFIIISGFSGVGKGTVVRQLMKNDDSFCLSVSATTRKKRDYEIENKDYFFVSKDKFLDMIEKNELLEYAMYNGEYYGTPRQYVENELEKGKNVILEIEYQGALKVKKLYKDAILIFIIPPSAKVLFDRLSKRNSENEEQVKRRIKTAIIESDAIKEYNYVLVNDDLKRIVDDLLNIVNGLYKNDFDYKDLLVEIINDIKNDNY